VGGEGGGGRLQARSSPTEHGVPVAEASKVDVEVGEAAEGGGRLVSVEVKDAEHHLACVLSNDVAGDEDVVLRQMQGDASVGVPRGSDNMCAASEVQDVAIGHLVVDANRRRTRKSGSDLGVQLTLELGEVRRGPAAFTSNDWRVEPVSDDLHVAPGGDLSCRPGVVVVEMGEDNPIEI
jgi:hypothetical protein